MVDINTNALRNFESMKFEDIKNNLAVVANDSGAANLITAWCKNIQCHKLRAKMGGPAKDIWALAFGHYDDMELGHLLDEADVLLSGTSFSSCLEHQARKIAKKRKIHNIAVLDHWVNYRERFIRNGVQLLPNEIWVTDVEALELAKHCFPDLPITLQHNFYLEEIVKKVKAHGSVSDSNSPRVLYVLEPIRQSWSGATLPGEFQALNYFIQNAKYLHLNSGSAITLRPHPSDSENKYNQWVKNQKFWNIKVDTSNSLESLIANSDLILGCETNAMVVAVACGKRAISTLPPQAPRCRLPNNAIKHLRDIVKNDDKD